METPYFLLHKDLLDSNYLEFRRALDLHWPNSIIAYSIKTNALPWILTYMNSKEALVEAVSNEEYQLARFCGFQSERIVFNGPIKSKDILISALEGGAIVNLDSEQDVQTVLENVLILDENVGLRININTNEFQRNDVEYTEDGFRFGFSEKNSRLGDLFEALKKRSRTGRFGLHFHCNSITRNVAVYEVISKFAARLINKYNLAPSFIDIGGGFFGGVEGKPKAEDYILAIKEILCTSIDINSTKLIIEPGSALIGSTFDFHTSVVDVKDTEQARIITTDGSRIHIDPMWKRTSYNFSLIPINKDRRSLQNRQIVCGYTCMDHDRIMALSNFHEVYVGDQIVYHRVGAYSVTFGGPFICYFPEVYLKEFDEIKLIRQRMTLQQYYDIETVKGKGRV